MITHKVKVWTADSPTGDINTGNRRLKQGTEYSYPERPAGGRRESAVRGLMEYLGKPPGGDDLPIQPFLSVWVSVQGDLSYDYVWRLSLVVRRDPLEVLEDPYLNEPEPARVFREIFDE